MSDKDQALLWGIKINEDGDGREYWYAGEGDPDHDGVLVWDGQNYDEGEALAFQIGGEMRPYLTLKQVMDVWMQERNRALANAPLAARQLLDGLFKSVGL